MKLSFLALCLPLYFVGVVGLRCLRIGKGCTEETKANITCELGHVTGPCSYCECAKGEGESCGGPFALSGKCAENLICASKNGSPEHFSHGICVKIREPLTEEPPYTEEPPQDPNVPQLLTEKPRPHSVVHVPNA